QAFAEPLMWAPRAACTRETEGIVKDELPGREHLLPDDRMPECARIAEETAAAAYQEHQPDGDEQCRFRSPVFFPHDAFHWDPLAHAARARFLLRSRQKLTPE